MNSILVVCEGNVCRSPMAEGLLAASLPGTPVSSAGLGALSGMPADETAVRLMRARGIDISAHRSVQLTRDACKRAELILVMSTEQRRRIEESYPFACGRVYRVGEFKKRDVPDPYRQPEYVFQEALQMIDDGVREWLLRIPRTK
jgi:protein-tyrosine phosphatase